MIVHDALMIEPTETESKEALDAFADALVATKEEAMSNLHLFHSAPHTTPVNRLDKVKAIRNHILCYKGYWNCLGSAWFSNYRQALL